MGCLKAQDKWVNFYLLLMDKLIQITTGVSVSKAKDTGTAESEQSCSLQSKVGTYWQLSGEIMSIAAAYVVRVLRTNRLVSFIC